MRDEIINNILNDINIVDVVKEHVELKKSGVNYTGLCPFHNEKTPSFVVSETKQIFKCFGCGEGGNVLTFIMKKQNMSFPEALETLAKKAGVEIKEKKYTPEQEKEQKKKDALYLIYKEAANFFKEQLHKHAAAKNYVNGRWDEKIIEIYGIGYAPDQWTSLYDYLRQKGFLTEALENSGLFREKNGKVYDFFRNRIMIPIYDRTCRIIAFSGRDFSEEKTQAKYINSPETIIYSKSKTLFGLNFAIQAIKKYDNAIIVEGNPDVIKLHQLEVNNVIATCGTTLSNEHINEIKKYTSNICLLYDTDDAGKKAIDRNAKIILEHQLNAFVIEIPQAGTKEKQDPDSYFTSSKQFAEIYVNNCIPYPVYLAKTKADKCKNNAAYAGNTIKEIVSMIYDKDISERESLIEQLSKIIPTKKVWFETIKSIEKSKKEASILLTENGRTNEQNKMFEIYGFYIDNNSYYFRSAKNAETVFQGSNFTLEPLFHIISTVNAKRLYKITNEFGVTREVEFPQRDLISIAAFKLKCESLGNFRFDAGDYGLSKIKAFLYEHTKTCEEITQLGWQKKGFWAWSNGVVKDGIFHPISQEGIIEYNKEYFYIPAHSSFYQSDEMLFQFERKFKNMESNITISNFAKKLENVYGENAIVGFSFYLASLFRDVIVSYFRFFPILNIFGPKGTGKSEMAITLLKLFGDLPVGLNMTNSTIASLADHVSHTKNAIVHIDEYKNSIEYDKIEFLKGLWDGTGRSRMNMDKDKKKETTPVDSGIILTGQEMTTLDIALFSRIIFLTVTKTKFTDTEKQNYNELKNIEKEGLTHITNQILKHRAYFVENYLNNYNLAMEDVSKLIDKKNIEDRIFRNWIVVLAAFRTLHSVIQIPFQYTNVLSVFANAIVKQNTETQKNNEISTFWEIFEYMVREGIIEENYDFSIKHETEIKTDKVNIIRPDAIKILYLDKSRILELYLEHGNRTKQKLLPKSSLQYYLMNSQPYMGEKKSWRFRMRSQKLNDKTSSTKFDGQEDLIKYVIKRAWVFNYDDLDIDLISEFIPKNEEKTDNNNKLPDYEEQTEMPF